MTAALGELTGPAVRGPAGRVLCVLALVLPVPLFAALGLSLPLPATVERIAAKLVPFGDSTRLAAGTGGSIALAPGEVRAGTDTAVSAPPASTKPRIENDDRHSVAAAGPGVVRPDPRTGDRNETSATTPTSAPTSEAERPTAPSAPQQNADGPTTTPTSGGGSSGGTQTGGGGSDPGGSQPVETVTNTANGAVETVTTAVTEATEAVEETTKGAVDSATDAGSGALGGIKPP